MLQLVGSPVAVLGPPFLHSPLPDGAVTLVVVETALVTPALAAVVDSRITSPEKASSAARRPEIRFLNMRALEKRSIRYLNVLAPDRLRPSVPPPPPPTLPTT